MHKELHKEINDYDGDFKQLEKNTLKFMLEFLEETSFYKNDNEMSMEEIAKYVGPVIMTKDFNEAIEERPIIKWLLQSFMIYLMKNYEALFEEKFIHANFR